jgi:[ribosomal protein S5]-alanine N-acetyltransferase
LLEPTFPELRTSRFLLRRIVPNDLSTVFAGLSNPQVIVNYGVSYESLEATQHQLDWFENIFKERTGIWWGISDPTMSKRLLGACGLNDIVMEHKRAELGYWLLPEQWGKGVAQECVRAILSYAFVTLGIHRVGADVDIENNKSSTLLETLGFQLEGVRRGCELKNGVYLDLKQYSLLSSDSVPRI